MVTNGQSGAISRYNPESDNFTHFRTFKDSAGSDISFDVIYNLREDANGLFWFTSGEKIYGFDPDRKIVSDFLNESKITPVLKNRDINFFQIDSKQNFWIVVASDLIKYNPNLDSIEYLNLLGKKIMEKTVKLRHYMKITTV